MGSVKRHSVFVSSTRRDTRDARHLVINALLTDSYIPIGMEFATSALKETRAHIEDLIAVSDYVCLIVKADYGDIPEGMDQSWTHFEYETAHRRGRPVIAFVYNGRRRAGPADPRVEAFVREIEQHGTTVRFWKTAAELGGAVLSSLKTLTQGGAAPGGWVRRDAFVDAEDSFEQFHRNSSTYDFTGFLDSPGDIKILLNDGYGWRRRHEQGLAARFRKRPDCSTTVITCDDRGEHLAYVAAKSQKSPEEQRADIEDFHRSMAGLARDCGYRKLHLLKSPLVNTHCLFICRDFAIVTPYFTTFHRFKHLPLLRYRSGTSLYDDLQQDFDIIARSLLAAQGD